MKSGNNGARAHMVLQTKDIAPEHICQAHCYAPSFLNVLSTRDSSEIDNKLRINERSMKKLGGEKIDELFSA